MAFHIQFDILILQYLVILKHCNTLIQLQGWFPLDWPPIDPDWVGFSGKQEIEAPAWNSDFLSPGCANAQPISTKF